jgi:hypothetical protein
MCCLASCCWDVNKCWAAGFTGMFRLYYLLSALGIWLYQCPWWFIGALSYAVF